MARTMTPYERQTIAASRVSHFTKLETRDADGTWQDASAILAAEFLLGASLSEHRDAQVASGAFRLRRRDGTTNLSPLMSGSLANRNAAAAYAPLLDIGREVRWSTATTRDGLGSGSNGVPVSEPTYASSASKSNGAETPAPATTWASPYGQLFQHGIHFDAWASGITRFAYYPFAAGAGKQCTISAFVRMADGSAPRIAPNNSASALYDIALVVGNAFVTPSTIRMVQVPGTNIYRVSGTGNAVDGTHFGVNQYSGFTTAKACEVVGYQVELGATMTDYVCTTGAASTSWRELFYGRIDEVAWENDPIVLDCSSLDGWLQDTQIETDAIQYGGPAVQAESVIQSIVTAWPSGKLTGAQSTVSTPASPGFIVTSYAQGRQKVLEACKSIAQQVAAWDFRFRYNAVGVSVPTFYDPGRARVTIDDTIGGDEYLDFQRVGLALGNIRNAGKAWYVDANGATQSVTQQDAASISKYGRRYFEITLSSAVTTAVQAQAVLDAVVNDLAVPGAEFTLTMLYHWGVQLFDRHTVTADGERFDTDQTLAIAGCSHEFADGSATGITTIEYAGKVVGAYASWLQQVTPALTAQPVITGVDVAFPSATSVELQAAGDTNAGSWRFAVSTAGMPTIATVRLGAVVVGQTPKAVIAQAVAVGQRLYIAALAYTGAAGTGRESELYTCEAVRSGSGYGAPPTINITETGAKTRTTATLRVVCAAGAGAVAGGMTTQYSVDGDETATSWTAPLAGSARTIPLARSNWAARSVIVRTTQADGQYTDQPYTVDARLDAVDIASGALVRAWAYDDASFATRSASVDGNQLHAAVYDSRSSANLLNNHYRYGIDGPGGVLETSAQKFVNGAALDASRNVDFSGAGFVNKTLDYVSDSTAFVRSPQFTGGANMAENAGFEAGAIVNGAPPGYVTTSGTATLDTASPASGTQSVKIVTAVTFGGISSARVWKVRPGEQYKLSVTAKTLAGATAFAFLDVVNGAGTAVLDAGPSTSSAAFVTISQVVTIPAGGYRMALCLRCSTPGGGTVWFDDVLLVRVTSIDDEIADGATYGRPLAARLSGGKPLIDFSEAIHVNRNLDNIPDGPANYGRALLARLSGGKPLIDFSEAIHLNKNLDNVADGPATYGRALLARLSAGKPLIDFAEAIHLNKNVDNLADGSGSPLAGGRRGFSGFDANSRLANAHRAGGLAIVGTRGLQNQIPLSSSGLTVTILAHTVYVGGTSISYPSGSASVGSANVWYVYMDDPNMNGGGTYLFTTNPNLLAQGDFRYYVGSIQTFTSGTGTAGGGGSKNAV